MRERFDEACRYLSEFKPADLDGPCPVFDVRGRCPFSLACRYANSHYDFEKKTNRLDDGRMSAYQCELNSNLVDVQARK